ncbi:MAG: hypothetical protein HQM08_27040 [Candidatus Riflebacteria bacterium]|nr:hypothetical protein [Candidatus Riflebacteria bacterium]
MKFRRDAPAVLICTVLVVVVSLSIISHRLFRGLTSSIEESLFGMMRSILEFNLRRAEDRALGQAEMIADLPAIRKLFAAQDRPGLLAETRKMFQVQNQKYGIDQAQFHLPPAISFLRLHDPDNFGDDLSAVRPLVVAVNREQTSKKGFALARDGPAIFGVTSVKDAQGNHLGSFEIGEEFGAVLDGLKNGYGLESALFLSEAPLKEFGKGVRSEVFSDQNRVGKYIRFCSTNSALLKALIFDRDLTNMEGGNLTREALGVPYGVILYPVWNGTGEAIGMIALAMDFSKSRSAEMRTLVWQVFFTLSAVVLLSGAILILLRGKLLRPLEELSKCFAALAEGDKSQQPPEKADLCDELTSLAQHYERLRKKDG